MGVKLAHGQCWGRTQEVPCSLLGAMAAFGVIHGGAARCAAMGVLGGRGRIARPGPMPALKMGKL